GESPLHVIATLGPVGQKGEQTPPFVQIPRRPARTRGRPRALDRKRSCQDETPLCRRGDLPGRNTGRADPTGAAAREIPRQPEMRISARARGDCDLTGHNRLISGRATPAGKLPYRRARADPPWRKHRAKLDGGSLSRYLVLNGSGNILYQVFARTQRLK